MQPSDIGDQFDRDGYVLLRDVVDDAALLDELDRFVDYLLDYYGMEPTEFSSVANGSEPAEHPFWTRLVSDDRILDVVEPILGPDIVHLSSTFFLKPPNSGAATRWHQDGAYWGDIIDPVDDILTLWIAPQSVTPDNACMRVIPGTHAGGYDEHEFESLIAQGQDDTGAEVDPDLIDESRAVDLEIQPGDVSIHHPTIYHSSYPNTSHRWRKGLAIRFMSTKPEILHPGERWRVQAYPVRGDPAPEGQPYQPWPRYDPDDPDQFAFRDWEPYNERAREMNAKLRADQLLSGDAGGDWPATETYRFGLADS